jgi:hypothetical protein
MVYIRQIAIDSRVVETVSYKKALFHCVTYIIRFHVGLTSFQFIDHDADFNGTRPAGLQLIDQTGHRQARIQYILDDQNILAVYIGFNIKEQADLAGTFGLISITAESDKIDNKRINGELPDQISHKNKSAMEHTDYYQVRVLIILGNQLGGG